MTCIVGVLERGKVWIGGDSCITTGNAYSLTEQNAKVIKLGPMLAGCAGSPRAWHLIKYCLDYPDTESGYDPIAWLVRNFANPVRELLKQHGFVTEDDFDSSNFQTLIGLSGRLFHFWSNYQITEHTDDFGAMGSGMDLALGALSVLPSDMPAKQRVRMALEAAARFDINVKAPFVIQSI